jgi:hypothetical protein
MHAGEAPLDAQPRRGAPPGGKHSLEARQKMAASRLGKPMDASTRAKMAEAHRQRQAVKREQAAACAPPVGKAARLRPPVRGRASAAGSPSSAANANHLTREDVQVYQRSLREYRTLRESLQGWSDAFAEQHHRRPDRNDVLATRIPWLVDTFNQYTLLKRSLVQSTSQLRGALALTARRELPRPLGPGETAALRSLDAEL